MSRSQQNTGADKALAPGVPAPGEIIGQKYRVERVLGVGGMGVVLEATHMQLQQPVAIKVLLPEVAANPEALARFTREAQAASSIRSEHVAQVLDVGEHGALGLPYMVMEYLDGLDLAQYLHQRGRLPVREAVDYVLQASEAVAQAHRLGVVHRDLKPSNLFLSRRADGSSLVKVLDFGISKVTTGSDIALTATSFAFGTPMYMSPEQIRSAKYVDPRTDIWAMGVILFELLTNELPFDGDTLPALSASITADQPKPLRSLRPDAPAEVEAAINRCLQKDLTSRPHSIFEVASALAAFGPPGSAERVERIERIGVVPLAPLGKGSGPAVDPHSTHSSWETGRPQAAASRRRVFLLAAAGSALVVGIAGAALLNATGSRDQSQAAPPASSAPALPASAPTPAASAPAPAASAPAPAASAAASSATPSKKTPAGGVKVKKPTIDVQPDRH